MTKDQTALKEILALSYKLRDVDLVPLEVALDDQEGACSPMSKDLLPFACKCSHASE